MSPAKTRRLIDAAVLPVGTRPDEAEAVLEELAAEQTARALAKTSRNGPPDWRYSTAR